MRAIINSVEDFISTENQLLGSSGWLTISQERINEFADATLDHQWIHVDEVRAMRDSEHGSTIAHGYLPVSLIPYFLDQILKVDNLDKIVNYGIDKMVFKAPVPVNSRLRMNAFLKSAKDLGNICLANIQCIFQIEGTVEPVLEGQIKYIYYFKENSKTNKTVK